MTKYQKLIGMMEAFVSGQSRSRDFVSQLEGEFATSDLDDDERSEDLKWALAMFGASDIESDNKMLAGECRYALRLLREDYDGLPCAATNPARASWLQCMRH